MTAEPAAPAAEVAPGAHVAPDAVLGRGVVVEPGAVIGAGVRLGGGTTVAAGAVVRPGTVIGEGCVIEECAVLGKAPRLSRNSRVARDRAGEPRGGEPLVLADGVTVCAGAVLCAGTSISAGVIIGDQAHVRERTRIGEGCIVGRGTAIDFDVVLGARVRIQTGVYVTATAVVEDDVFLAPGVTMTNDRSAGRRPSGTPLRGPVLRRGCRIGGGAVLLPGIEVGPEAFVGAGSVVTADVPARTVVVGVPARRLRDVAAAELLA